MKKCYKCKKEKELEEFRKKTNSKDGYAPNCKSCMKLYDKNRWSDMSEDQRKIRTSNVETSRDRNHRFVFQYLSENPCITCGETDPIVLEFDHRDPTQKISDVSKMVPTTYSLKKIKEEISKCDVLCANCHRRKTANQFGFYRLKLLNEIDE